MMSQPAPERDASHVLTLEEISKLAAEGGKPAETLMNVVALIATRFQTDVCSAYLLEPESDDGLTTWNFLDSSLKAGGLHPVLKSTP